MEEIGTAVTVSVSAKQRLSFSVKILMGIATYFASGFAFFIFPFLVILYIEENTSISSAPLGIFSSS